MKTIKDVLVQAKLGDVVTDGKRSWKVVDVDFDGAVVARPVNFPKKESPFELWSLGVESIAKIPGLKIKKD